MRETVVRTRQENLSYIFAPSSVAVIGASTREDSLGRAVFANILFSGFTGIVYPVNPKAKSILGVRAYPSVLDIPDEIDLGVIIVPSAIVPQVLHECGEKGIKGAVIITAGFKEIGGRGAELEEKVKQIASEHGISLIGPNCFGVVNTDPSISFNATFARSMPKTGNIAFVSQSGALGATILEYARQENIGFSKFVSFGNKADINENDLLEFLGDDSQTDVVLLYLEDLEEPREFIGISREITDRKPILAIKSGRTIEGAKAASSHTGALAGSDEAYDSFFIQSGVLRVDTLEELFDYARPLANQPLPSGGNVAIVTNAGGPGIMATDVCVRHGLKLASFAERTRGRLEQGLPPTASVNNPVDLIGDAKEDRYELALSSVLEDENVDGAIVICTPHIATKLENIARTIAQVSSEYEKPVLACLMTIGEIEPSLKVLEQAKIPHYRFPEAAARAMANMARYVRWVHRPRTEIKLFQDVDKEKVRGILAKVKGEQRTFLPEPEAHALLQAYGFPVLDFHLARDEQECVKAAKAIGYPVALKIVSPDILHKVDVGGVKVSIKDESQLRSEYKDLLNSVNSVKPEATIWGVLVQRMAKPGKEMIIGMKRDPHFGPILVFGLGGIYVEALQDVAFRIAPIRELSSYHMIEQIRGHKILEEFRGEPASDIAAIAECIQRLSQLALDFEELEEIDINPLMVYEKGAGVRVVDARVLIS